MKLANVYMKKTNQIKNAYIMAAAGHLLGR